jgi:steroid delta-isomerase-like uncharacterized protein
MPEGNESVVRRLLAEVINGGSTDLLSGFIAPDHVGHDPLGDHYGPEGMRIAVAEYRAAFSDLQVTAEDFVTEGDKVVHRFTLRGTHTGPFMGVPPSGRVVTVSGIGIDRFADGKVAESWISLDALSLLRQLGAAPTPERRADGSHADHVH